MSVNGFGNGESDPLIHSLADEDASLVSLYKSLLISSKQGFSTLLLLYNNMAKYLHGLGCHCLIHAFNFLKPAQSESQYETLHARDSFQFSKPKKPAKLFKYSIYNFIKFLAHLV